MLRQAVLQLGTGQGVRKCRVTKQMAGEYAAATMETAQGARDRSRATAQSAADRSRETVEECTSVVAHPRRQVAAVRGKGGVGGRALLQLDVAVHVGPIGLHTCPLSTGLCDTLPLLRKKMGGDCPQTVPREDLPSMSAAWASQRSEGTRRLGSGIDAASLGSSA